MYICIHYNINMNPEHFLPPPIPVTSRQLAHPLLFLDYLPSFLPNTL